jgi:hypothetical protein
MDEDAIDLIAERLRTPLQIEMYLTPAFEQGFCVAAKPVTVDIVEQVLSCVIDDLEPHPDAERLRRRRAHQPAQHPAVRCACVSRRNAGHRTYSRTDRAVP